MIRNILPCGAKGQYLLTLQVGSYFLRALQSSIGLVMTSWPTVLLEQPFYDHFAISQYLYINLYVCIRLVSYVCIYLSFNYLYISVCFIIIDPYILKLFVFCERWPYW